jgi:acyl carrier protein
MSWSEADVRDIVMGVLRQLAPEPQRFGESRELHLVDDLGFHSLALLELAFAIEDEFDLPSIDEETGRAIRTTEQVLQYVLSQLRSMGELIDNKEVVR